jgi:hypothetical protein
LDNNPISCVCLHSSDYDFKNFPYERELTLWKFECNKGGGSNMVDSLKYFNSKNELDYEDNFDKSGGLSFDHLSDLEDETNTWNFEL